MSGPVEHLVSLAVVVDGVELPIQREADISHGHPFVQVSPGSLFSLKVREVPKWVQMASVEGGNDAAILDAMLPRCRLTSLTNTRGVGIW